MAFSEYEDDLLTDFVFQTNMSNQEIANELGKTEVEITKEIRNLGLSWVRRRKGHISRGQSALLSVMSELLPGEEIVTEEPIGNRLRLDIYCPKFKLAAEYHGRQHFEYVPFFHGDKEGFLQSQRRDEKKIQICKDLGIALVAFRYCDSLTQENVYNRLLEAIRNAPPPLEEEKPSKYKGNAYYEAAKRRQRERRREQYRKMKSRRGRGRN